MLDAPCEVWFTANHSNEGDHDMMSVIERRRMATAAVLASRNPQMDKRELEMKVDEIVSRVTCKAVQVPGWTIDDTGKPGVFLHPKCKRI
jgi:hypothetical protein